MEENYEILERLGEGSYGAVSKARNRKTDEVVAIKVIPIESDQEELQREIDILEKCNSTHIVTYYESFVRGDELWVGDQLLVRR
jgi:serine/threonine protein kinase